MKKEIEITRWIIRVEETKDREKADLVGFDVEGNEYTFQYWDGVSQAHRKQDIIVTKISKRML